MNIACSTDDKFIQHCCVMLCSVLVNNSDVDVYLLSEGIADENLEKIKREVTEKNGRLHYILVDDGIINNLPLPKSENLKHISKATYYRLFLSEFLPSNVEKVIYLDCDIIVRKSLEEMWNVDITSYSIGAVYQMYEEVKNAKRLGYDLNYGYFNAGVLIVNLQYWRDQEISKKLIAFLIENSSNIIYHDQDALNAVLYKSVLRLPCKWNMISFFFERQVFSYVGNYDNKIISYYDDYKKEIKNEINNPSLIHFVSKPKPWDRYCLHPFVREYYKYAKLSIEYKDIKTPNYMIVGIYRCVDNVVISMKYYMKKFMANIER